MSVYPHQHLIEYIEFNELRNVFENVDIEIFEMYLKEVFDGISTKNENNSSCFITKNRFLNFIRNIPIFIAGKVLDAFTKYKSKILMYKDFKEPLLTLKYGTYEKVAFLIFNIFDFDKDRCVNTGDIRLLLSYLPLKEDSESKAYKYQIKSLDELDEIINYTFEGKEKITYEDFLDCLEKKRADIFLQFFSYLYLYIPIFDKDFTLYKKKISTQKMKKVDSDKKDLDSLLSSVGTCYSPKTSPKRLIHLPSMFSPLPTLRGRMNSPTPKEEKNKNPLSFLSPLSNAKITDKPQNSNPPNSPYTTSLKKDGVVRIKNKTISQNHQYLKKMPIKLLDSNAKVEKKLEITSSKEIMANPYKNKIPDFLKRNHFKEELKKSGEFFSEKKNEEEAETILIENEEETTSEIKINFQGELSSFKTKNDVLVTQHYFMAIMDLSIYYYKDKNTPKEDYYKSKFIQGCFIKENKSETIEGENYNSFTIIFPEQEKKRTYYHKDYQYIVTWIKYLRQAIGYQNFFDFYSMEETIGEGAFGVIKLGINKLTNMKVAIKILGKENIKNKEDWDLIKTEIDIMKISKHPNIINFIDHFENSDFIFIVMEYLNSGNLQDYLEKKKFKLSEPIVKNIAFQMAHALQYLHKLGIIHRDFKPHNIMLVSKIFDATKLEIKIMDFGLSKILGTKEKANEGVGTISYIAPEILMRKPYNKAIDIWSFGVTIYHMLSGELPFCLKNPENMVNTIIQKDLNFSSKFTQKSLECQNLIKRCLEKMPTNRITIDEIINHSWFKSTVSTENYLI